MMREVRFECPSCGKLVEASEDMAGQLIACPSCKDRIKVRLVTKDFARFKKAHIVTRSVFIGRGCLVQWAGLIACGLSLRFFGFAAVALLGIIVGVSLFCLGTSMARECLCSACGSRVNKKANPCPMCNAEFE